MRGSRATVRLPASVLGGGGLRLPIDQDAALSDRDGCLVDVHVLPPEAADLATRKAAHRSGVEQRPRECTPYTTTPKAKPRRGGMVDLPALGDIQPPA